MAGVLGAPKRQVNLRERLVCIGIIGTEPDHLLEMVEGSRIVALLEIKARSQAVDLSGEIRTRRTQL